MNAPVTLKRLGADAARFVAKEKKLFIDGQWVPAAENGTIDVIDPATGLVFDRVPDGTGSDIDKAVAAARRAFDDGPWATMTPADRGKLVWRLGDLVEKHADELAELEALDNGKPVTDARNGDVTFSYELLRYMAGWSTKICGQTIPLSAGAPFHAYTLREPIGVCGQIVPWNFSFMMAIWKVAPALAAGCTIVLKPAEQTPLTALRLAELVEEAGFPAGVFNVVTGYGETAGAALAAHPDVDKVAFTGSTEVGKKILDAAKGNLKKVSLELGGKSPMIVFADADPAVAIPAIAYGIFYNMGQTCTAGTRLYVHKDIADTILTGLKAFAEGMSIGVGLDPKTQIGPLVSQEQFDRVSAYVKAGLADGAKLYCGGNRAGSEGYFLEPTILTETSAEMSVVREEIFGPVLVVATFDDDGFEAIVKEANNSIYGLAGSVFTRDVSRAHKVAKKLKAGTIGVNTHHVIDPALPFGGFNQSGWGREQGYEAILLYTEVKSVGIAL
ncbi:aldehyde dehydrogenase family protein (plasmid) [Agrobacterium tumefaciens]|uniref:Aldehyde dehydrogenase family protein n=1 Tax=Agrobacterium tumefaciens TaxID=358 RepID=A0AAP9J948_AGRTU|nr:aldehyde dehydrogenase family protein [Agrobacterium tumefaciens]NSZ60081.1 aldehyde dehydrogenase family protein [Agrobacterium tumefaciens]QDY97681.1 aldehyde dehydrogenase family protein [Agrobacterium tumefaciens]UXS12804.1 aldehyde dehydrogenase family protein [Agrobacterium tumefaciens]UXS20165.1 aldehyde dehydrogenase family protein [Agrobacterium tumefaciens]UXS27813.1 aldehyde dehydrogenase family protein [Agrobacterium tumefaciens]